MRPDDFFEEGSPDPVFGLGTRRVKTELLTALRTGPLDGADDIEVAVPLALLIHDNLETYGTSGGQEMSEEDMRLALLTLRAVRDRLGIAEGDIPFRDFSSFRTWWVRNGAHGSWQGRRDLLNGIFEPLHNRLAQLEQNALASSLADPISSQKRTGWSQVDTEISELRRHFQSARTAQDYRNVGHDCVAVTEALSECVYKPEGHLREGETEPPVANTKQRLDRFVEDAAPGPDNARLRKLARDVIEYAQHVKHSGTPTRREAGIAADAVIQLANMLRRLDEHE